MKAFFPTLFLTCALLTSLSSPLYAQIEVERNIADGVAAKTLPLSREELEKLIEIKQQKMIAEITLIASESNSQQISPEEKEEAQYAYTGFMARLERLRQEREELEKKELPLNSELLLNYSKHLERLDADLETFLR